MKPPSPASTKGELTEGPFGFRGFNTSAEACRLAASVLGIEPTDKSAEALMDAAVARLNIAHCRERLAAEPDGATRERLLRLLAEEEAKLQAIMDQLKSRKTG